MMKLYTNGQIIQPSEADFLELEGYEVVKSYSKLNGSNWYKYNAKQAAFYEANPTATPLEVYNMKIEIYEPTLEDLKAEKIAEIEHANDAAEKFEIDGYPIWLDKNVRNDLLTVTLPALKQIGIKQTLLWDEVTGMSFDVPVDFVLENLPRLVVYAKIIYDKTQSLLAAVKNAQSKEEVENITVDGYPDRPVFNIPAE